MKLYQGFQIKKSLAPQVRESLRSWDCFAPLLHGKLYLYIYLFGEWIQGFRFMLPEPTCPSKGFLSLHSRTLLWILQYSDDTRARQEVNSLRECEHFTKKESFPPASLKPRVFIQKCIYFGFSLRCFQVPAAKLGFVAFSCSPVHSGPADNFHPQHPDDTGEF